MKIQLFFRWLAVIFLAISLIAQFALGKFAGGMAVIPVLFFAALPVFSTLFRPNSDHIPKLAYDAITGFAWFRACWGFCLCLAGVAGISEHEYWPAIPMMMMGLIFFSPLDRILFREYKSLIPALSVRPRYDAVKVATACWWVLATLLFIIGDSDYMSKEYGEGTIFLSFGFALIVINPAAALCKNWEPSKARNWSDVKKDMARAWREEGERQAKKEAERKAKADAARQEREKNATVTSTSGPSSTVTPAKTSPPPTATSPSPVANPVPVASLPIYGPPAFAKPSAAGQPPPGAGQPPSSSTKPASTDPPNEYLLLIRKGESSTLEFKSTLRVDLKTQKAEKFIQHSVLKTLAAFLNSQGGTLLIGVEDNRNILGLAADFDSFSKPDKLDEFQKFLDTLLGNSIGNRFHRNLEVEFPEVEGKIICVIRVKTTARDPVYIKNEAGQELFFIRRLASTIDLQPSEAIKYIREHWP